jgi:hypothetical protein
MSAFSSPASEPAAENPTAAPRVSHYYLGRKTLKVFAYQEDCNTGEELITVDLHLTDKRLNAVDMSNFAQLVLRNADGAVAAASLPEEKHPGSKAEGFLGMNWIQRLEYALAHPENLRTGVKYNQTRGYLRGKGLEYYRYSGENFLEEMRSGMDFSRFNESQRGLIRCVVDAAFRRGDFSGLPDHGC